MILGITGANGFIGLNIINYIQSKNKKLSNEKIELNIFNNDIRDKPKINEFVKNSDIIFHLAAKSFTPESFINPDEFFSVNVLGTLNILESLRKNIKKLIFASTLEVYGDTNKIEKTTEDFLLNPQSPYATSKVIAEYICKSYKDSYNIPIVILRLGNQYGPNQRKEKLIPNFISKAMNKESLEILGNGEQIRSWTYIEDTIEAFLKAVESNSKEFIFNITSNQELSIINIAKIINSYLKNDNNILFKPERKLEIKKLTASAKKAKKILNWEARTSFEEGIKKTIEWYKNNN